MLLNPMLAMLCNTRTGLFHPLILDENPLPGPPAPGKPRRYKSVGHHEIGFNTKAAADLSALVTYKPLLEKSARAPSMRLDLVFHEAWTDPEIPVIVHLAGDF